MKWMLAWWRRYFRGIPGDSPKTPEICAICGRPIPETEWKGIVTTEDSPLFRTFKDVAICGPCVPSTVNRNSWELAQFYEAYTTHKRGMRLLDERARRVAADMAGVRKAEEERC